MSSTLAKVNKKSKISQAKFHVKKPHKPFWFVETAQVTPKNNFSLSWKKPQTWFIYFCTLLR